MAPFPSESIDENTVAPSCDYSGISQVYGVETEHLRIHGEHIWALDIIDCPKLLTLDLTGCRSGLYLAVVRCPELRCVKLPEAGNGAIVHWDMRGVSDPQGRIEGAIEHLELCGYGFHSGLPEDETASPPWVGAQITSGPSSIGKWIHACLEGGASAKSGPAKRVHFGALANPQVARELWQMRSRPCGGVPVPELQSCEVPSLVHVAQQGEQAAVDLLLEWAEDVPQRGLLLALCTLLELVKAPGVTAQSLWDVRCSLAGRLRKRNTSNPEWKWRLPRDSHDEILCTDFRLFAHCRGRATGTQKLDVFLRNAIGSRELRLLGQCAYDSGLAGNERELAAGLAREALAVSGQGLVAKPVGTGHYDPLDDLSPLVNWVVADGERVAADHLVAYLGRYLFDGERLDYLSELAIHGHAASRQAATAIALERPVLRQEAMAIALTPGQTNNLAENAESTEGS